jgi:hypothetical protein
VRALFVALALAAGSSASAATLPVVPVNIIDGTDERGSLLEVGPNIGLSAAEIERIRKVSGHVACFAPVPKVGSGALYLSNGQVLTAGHIFFDGATRQSKCFFRPQTPGSAWHELDAGAARFGASPPKPGSNDDWAVVRLKAPLADAAPFRVMPDAPVKAGDALIVITAQPEGFETLDPNVPVAQPCRVRRAPVSSAATSFYRSDCDASGGSSGGMHLARVDGELVFRGMTITTGPVKDPKFVGAPYDEKKGSVTTALGVDAAILAAGKALAGMR